MTAASVLTAALELIATPGRWTQEHVARDANGNPVKATDDRAQSFCMVGAIQRQQSDANAYGQAIRHLRTACGGSIFQFNDTHGHKAIREVMRRAIEIAGEAA